MPGGLHTMDTTQALPTNPPEEKRTLRDWLAENNPPPGMTSDICTMRCLVALGCTERGWDPGSAGRTPMTRSQLVELMQGAKDRWRAVQAEHGIAAGQEHWMPIFPADKMLYAIIARKPEPGQIAKFTADMMEGALAAMGGERNTMRLTLQTQMLKDCTVFPDASRQHAVYTTYGGLQQELANKVQRLASEAVEEILGK